MAASDAARAAALIGETFLAFPESLELARRRLETLRRRRIRVTVTEPGDLTLPTGLWLTVGRDLDIVWADATLTPSHQLITICHEFGHMICGHTPSRFPGPAGGTGVARESVARLVGVAPEEATAVLGRCGIDLPAEHVDERRREREAETVGRALARPFVHSHESEIAALLLGR